MVTVKSAREIALMRRAGDVISLVFEKVEGFLKPGVSTSDIDKLAEEVILSRDGKPSFKGYNPGDYAPPYPASICTSVNDEVVHGIPGLRTLNDGDIISIDVGVYLDGYHADAARTYAVGKISDEAARLIRVTKESFFKGIEQAVEGNRIGDISEAVQKHVEAHGYSVVRDLVGHGIGRDLHEAPSIPNFVSRSSGPRLVKGMTLAVEPMVCEGKYTVKIGKNCWTISTQDGGLSAHYENTIAVTAGKPAILTGE